MSNKDDGGAAFPSAGVVIDYDKNEHQQGAYGGMSLRDYFAAKAMQGQMEQFKFSSSKEMRELASFAYEAADAMLAERAK